MAFPDYPIPPQLKLGTIQEDYVISRWQQEIVKWKEADAGKFWCGDMNNWFINHEFNNKEEVKMVVKDWLLKLEEVVVKGCLEIDEINVIVRAAETLLRLDNNNSLFHLDDVFILMSIFTDSIPNIKSKKEIERFVVTKKTEKKRLLETQRKVFKALKHNLEGIIEGNQNELLPFDTGNCLLAKYFPSVCNDVRKIWNKLQDQSIKNKSKVEYTEEVVPEVSKKREKVPVLEYTVLQEHRVEMVNKLEPEKIIPYLIQNNVIDRDDVEIIQKKCKDLRRKGAETMLNILYRSGSWAFGKLIKALLNAGYQEMAKTLREHFKKKTADPLPVKTTKERGCLSEIEFDVLRDNHERLVNELDSSILKNHLFKNGLIDEDDLEKISKKEEELRKEGAEEMINIIHKSGANAFPKFIKSLHDAGYYELSLKLETDFKQKKKEKTYEGMKIDLNLVAFRDYPIPAQPSPESVQGDDDKHDWNENVKEWVYTRYLWCYGMNSWFKDHEFNNKEEVKVVVKDWLLKLEEVVVKGLTGKLYIVIIYLADIVLKLDNDNSPLHLKYNKEMLLKVIKIYCGCESMKEIEEFVQTNKEKKKRILEQQRQFFKTLKHNLEGIIKGSQNELLPIDTETCLLAKFFPSVCDDVREIWNKVQDLSIESKSKVEYIEEVLPEVSKKRGKVPVLEYTVLQEHRVEMVNKLEPEKIIPYLKENNVLDKDDMEAIEKKCKKLRRKGAETMLDILYESGSWAFSQLISALKQAGYRDMTQKLTDDLEKKRADPGSVTSTKQRGLLSPIEFDVLRDNHERLVNELDSSILKNHLFQNNLIDLKELKKITEQEEELKQETVEEMINIIYNSGEDALPGFIKSLRESGYDELSLKLETDLKQKKKERTYEGMTIEFPDYPIPPKLSLEDIQSDDDIHDWGENVEEWYKARNLWCPVMNSWFKDHEFNNKEELKVVVKNWLLKLEEVLDKGLIGGEILSVILIVAEIVLKLDNNNSPLHLKYNKEMLLKVIKIYYECESMKEIEEFVQIKKAKKEKLLEQQRQFFKTLKHNLEGIIEGNQNKLLPFDTDNSKLVWYFRFVCDDVREIWNDLE